jgi:hypothetical protein
MTDFKKIMNHVEFPEVTANFFVLYKEESVWIDGWISLENSLDEFISLLQGEIEYSWGSEYANMDDYIIFHIDIEDKNNLKEIKDNEYYLYVRQLKKIFLVILHKDIQYRIIENLPPVFDWFMDYYSSEPL